MRAANWTLVDIYCLCTVVLAHGNTDYVYCVRIHQTHGMHESQVALGDNIWKNE